MSIIAERDRARATAVRLEQESHTAYQSGRDAAAQAVIDYAHATHEPHNKRTACTRCDITAALIVAAQHARGES